MSDNHQLNLAPGFAAPRAIAARTVFISGTKGSGKTHNAGVMAEEMLASGVHVVVLDPLGVWWGLRHDASGGPGGFPIVILGGEHADAPLLPTAGELVADYIVRSGQSVILDMSGFAANAEQDRFVTDLLHKLFRLKAADKSAMHLIIDEADMFIPQQALAKTEIPLIGAAKTIVTKGRSRGLSMTMITQRPQSIAKSAIEEADVLLCHRMQGVRSVKAMREWTDLYATAEQARTFFDSLPMLEDGECWAWSPQFLKTFQRVKIRAKKTFDSSRTPDPGQSVRKPRAAATVDLDKLTAEIRATAEQAKANDPRELKRQIAELNRQIKTLGGKSAAGVGQNKDTTAPKRIEVPVLKDSQIASIEKLSGRLDASMARAMELFNGLDKRLEACRKIGDEMAEAVRTIDAAVKLAKAPATPAVPVNGKAMATALHSAGRPRTTTPVSAQVPRREAIYSAPGTGFKEIRLDVSGGAGLPAGEKSILTACAQHPGGVTREQLTILSGYKKSSRDTYLQRLRQRGFITDGGGGIVATAEGMAALGNDFQPLPTGGELRSYWLARLPEGERRMLDHVASVFPNAMTRDELREATGYKKSSRDTYLQRLSARKLIEPAGPGQVRASEMLFG